MNEHMLVWYFVPHRVVPAAHWTCMKIGSKRAQAKIPPYETNWFVIWLKHEVDLEFNIQKNTHAHKRMTDCNMVVGNQFLNELYDETCNTTWSVQFLNSVNIISQYKMYQITY